METISPPIFDLLRGWVGLRAEDARAEGAARTLLVVLRMEARTPVVALRMEACPSALAAVFFFSGRRLCAALLFFAVDASFFLSSGDLMELNHPGTNTQYERYYRMGKNKPKTK